MICKSKNVASFHAHGDPLTANVALLDHELAFLGVHSVYLAYANGLEFASMPQGVGAFSYTPEENHLLVDTDPELGFAVPVNGNTLAAYKNDFSAMRTPEMLAFIRQHDPNMVILSGVLDDCCVLETAVDLADEGFHVVVATETADAGRPIRPTYRTIEERAERLAAAWEFRLGCDEGTGSDAYMPTRSIVDAVCNPGSAIRGISRGAIPVYTPA
jgi:hypothetical protein